MTEKVLINAGYKEAPVPVVEQYANRFFQKKIKDDKGIKYFIDVYEYEISNEYNYEFKLVTQKDKFWVRTTIYSIENMTIEEIEKEMKTFGRSASLIIINLKILKFKHIIES